MRSPFFLTAAFLLVCSAAFAQQGPPYYDHERSLKKQREAAKVAKEKARSTNDPAVAAALLNDTSVYVRDDVFRVLVSRDDEALLKGLARYLGARKAPLASAAIAELYGVCKFGAGREALEKSGLRARDENTVLESIWALELLGSAESGKALEKVWKKRNPSYRIQGDALIALASVDAKRAEAHVTKALSHKVLPLRIAGLEAQARLGLRRGIVSAVEAIGADKIRKGAGWEARILFASCDLIERWYARAKEQELVRKAVDALIERLDRAEGLSKHRCATTLADLTGEALGDDAEIWRGWWQARRDAFVPKDKPKPEKTPAKKKRKSKKGAKKGEGKEPEKEEKKKEGRVETGGAKKTRVRFHGIPIHSKRLLFAQDVSRGMNNPVNKKKSGSPSKMAFSAKELKRVLKALSDDVATNVCFFATEYYFTAEHLFSIKRARQKLLSFVGTKAVTPKGTGLSRSNLYDVLSVAFEDPDIDTVFFLSEGGPTEGQFLHTPRFMRHLLRKNVYSRVRVHCLQVALSPDGEKFLRRLSDETGGNFYDMAFLKKAHGL
jgi:hypothetical protein